MKIRLLSFSLAGIMLLSLVSAGSAAEPDPTPNQALLNAMLNGDRHWVIDTLVADNRASNPMAVLIGNGGENSMARSALNTYRGIDVESETYAAAYRGMVQTMEKVYSADEYLGGLLDGVGELLAWVAGLFTGAEDARQMADDLTASTDELRYENLLKSVFTSSYTASDGTTLGESENALIMVRQVKNALDYFNSFMTLGRQQAESVVGSSAMAEFDLAYVDQYAIPYANAARSYLDSLEQLAKPDSGKNTQQMTSAITALALISNLSMAAPEENYLGFSYRDYLADYLTDTGVMDVLKAGGKTLDIASTAVDSYLYINSIQSQKEAVSGSVERLAAAASDTDMKKSLSNFAHMLSDEYDSSLLSYDSVVTYLRQNNTINNFTWQSAAALFQKLTHISSSSLGAAVISSATNVTGVSSWVADQAVGLKDTCKKTYELLYWEDLVDLCVEQYYSDVSSYKASPSEARAALVLDDLQLLQRLRLYGEKTAYGIAAAQLDSWLGQLFWGGEGREAYDKLYQNSVDVLMAASIIPPMDGITVSEGDMLTIGYDARIGYYGTIIRDGKILYLPELGSQLSGGLTVYGNVGVLGNSEVPLGIGYLRASGDCVLGAVAGQVLVDELYQSGGLLELKVTEGAALEVTDTLYAVNCSYQSDSDSPLPVHDLELNGSFSGPLLIKGDITASSGNAGGLTLHGEDEQTVSGSLTCSELRLLGKQVRVDGKLTVTGALYSPDAQVAGGRNLLLSGGTLTGGSYHGDLSLENASLPSTAIYGSLYDRGGTLYGGQVDLYGNLELRGDSAITAGSTLDVRQSVSLVGKSMTGAGTLRVAGDLSASGQAAVSRAILGGAAPQEFSGTMTVENLSVANPAGVTVSGSLTVQSVLSQTGQGLISGDPVILADGADLESDQFHGNLSVSDWAMDQPRRICGDLIIRDGGQLAGAALEVTGTLTADGTAAIQGASVTAGRLDTGTALTTDSPLTVLGDASCGGKLDNSEEIHIIGDLLVARALSCSGALRLSGDLKANDTMTVSALTLDGRYRQELWGTVRAGDFLVYNTTGVKNNGSVFVSGRYENTGAAMTGNAVQVGKEDGLSFTADTVLRGDQAVNGSMTLENCTVTIQGDLSVSGSLKLTNAVLVVQGRLTLSKSGAALTVGSGSSLTAMGPTQLKNLTVTQDGTMTVGSDLYLSDTGFNGLGTLCLRGDLISNKAVTQQALMCKGLVRQRLDAVQIKVVDLTLDNSAKGGVCLDCPVSYSGTADLGDTAVFSPENLSKEGA